MAKDRYPHAYPALPRVIATQEFADWARRLADRERVTVSSLIEIAIVSYAKGKNFGEPAPPRRA